jgi:4-hydroxy-tetrahydrodipicolinate synthase
MIEAFDRGAVGVMPGCSLFDLYLQIVTAQAVGDRARAMTLHTDLLAVLNQIRQDVEMIIRFEKHILWRRGFVATDYCRQPSYEPDQYEQRLFAELFKRVKPHLSENRP